MENTFIKGSRKITYYSTETNRPGRPILVIFHGAGFNKTPAKFKDKNLNVIALMDTFGLEGKGSWYLGEKGDLFWIDAIKDLLEILKEKYETDKVFFWGSSMGGYAAILHGYLNHVAAVYANVPQTKLLGSTYIQHGKVDDVSMQDCIEYAIVNQNSPYNDLSNIFNEKTDTLFFLTYNQLEGLNYFSEQGFPFLRKLHGIRQKFYLEVHPSSKHSIIYNISESLNLFKKYIDMDE
ncbi:hypothetical protein BKK52_02645 [Rodentibacter trehalosifermentans]|uniref:Alpha/beta hydrolase n=1 Tax=Rodentibacter trehalosifermentans TaxID=1908263 RepID=A0A1V3J4K7_9PAST|nr:hypothetical protein [Rodentibacter trehalosifermentans]OOF49734.1 hypothetical protein BKK52_02645 [Rodentibacter trehalosifermentans]